MGGGDIRWEVVLRGGVQQVLEGSAAPRRGQEFRRQPAKAPAKEFGTREPRAFGQLLKETSIARIQIDHHLLAHSVWPLGAHFFALLLPFGGGWGRYASTVYYYIGLIHGEAGRTMTNRDRTVEHRELRDVVRRARGIVVLTGAGVSAESGVPTFRDRDGIWARFDPSELATPEAFARDPGRVWEWYALRRQAMVACAPNPGHRSVARLLLARPDVTLVTQNVDGLHQRAIAEEPEGATADLSGRVLELHGSLMRSRCSKCGVEGEGKGDGESEPPSPPSCLGCGGYLRPAVVWFGELLDPAVLDAAFEAARSAELCIVAGTSAVVHPAASIPFATLESGGSVLEVNPEETPLTRIARWSLRGPSGRILPELFDS